MALIIGSVTRVVSSVVLVEVSDSESVVGTVEWGYQVLVTWFKNLRDKSVTVDGNLFHVINSNICSLENWNYDLLNRGAEE